MRSKLLIILAAAAVALAGCPASKSGSVYSRDDARREATVRQGVVESVRSVTIEGTKTPVGAVAGGALAQLPQLEGVNHAESGG